VAQRHHESPGAPGRALRVHEDGASTKVHLRGLARGKAQAYSHIGGDLIAQLVQHAHDGRVASAVGMFALECGVDGAALHAGVKPTFDHLAMWLNTGDSGAGPTALTHRAGDGLVVGDLRLRIKPALLLRHRAQHCQLVAPHQPRAGQLAYGIARAKAHEHLSVMKHLESPTTHGNHLPGKKPER